MPRIRDCVICGKRFTSYHGINVCSEQCKIEKKRRQYENSNKRRYSIDLKFPLHVFYVLSQNTLLNNMFF